MKKCEFEGTCAVCEGVHKVRGQVVVLHGYERPGIGYVLGDCYGHGRLAWEISPEAAEDFLKLHLRPTLAARSDALRRFDAGLVTKLKVQKPAHEWADIRNPEFTELTRDDGPRWTVALTNARYEARRERDRALEQVKRFEERIAAWKPAELRPVQPEPKHVRIERDEKDDWWKVRTLASGVTVGGGSTVEKAMLIASAKGWTLPPGVAAPAEWKRIDTFRAWAALPLPKNPKLSMHTKAAWPIVGRMVVAAYEKLDDDARATFDRRPQHVAWDAISYNDGQYGSNTTDKLTQDMVDARVARLARRLMTQE